MRYNSLTLLIPAFPLSNMTELEKLGNAKYEYKEEEEEENEEHGGNEEKSDDEEESEEE